MTQKIGPREQQLRELREREFVRSEAHRPKVGALREKVAGIPARKPPKQKKGRKS